MATGVFFGVCGLDSLAGCVLGLEHQFHMGTHLCEIVCLYVREVDSGQTQAEDGGLLPILQLPFFIFWSFSTELPQACRCTGWNTLLPPLPPSRLLRRLNPRGIQRQRFVESSLPVKQLKAEREN